MPRYSIDLYSDADGWKAVISECLVVGLGDTPEGATSDAIERADQVMERLSQSGLDGSSLLSQITEGGVREKLHAQIIRTLVRFGLPIVILSFAFMVVYFTVRQDMTSQVQSLRAAIASNIQSSNTTSSTQQKVSLTQAAIHFRELLLPVAKELNPLVRALIKTEDCDMQDDDKKSVPPDFK